MAVRGLTSLVAVFRRALLEEVQTQKVHIAETQLGVGTELLDRIGGGPFDQEPTCLKIRGGQNRAPQAPCENP